MTACLALTINGSTPGLLQLGTIPRESPCAQRQLGKSPGTDSAEPHSRYSVSWWPPLPAQAAPLLPSALPFPQGPVEGDLWDRLIAGSRVCPGLLVPEVVSGGTCRPCGEREALS